MSSSEIWWCVNCGPVEDPLARRDGCCPCCGSNIIRIPPPQFPDAVPDGISRHFAEAKESSCNK